MLRSSLSVLTLLLLCSGARAADRPPKSPPASSSAPSPDTCTEVRGSARAQGFGYTHVVSLRNGCPTAVSCELWSDVDPDRVRVEVAAGATAEIVTRRGSPAREVVGYKKCSFR